MIVTRPFEPTRATGLGGSTRRLPMASMVATLAFSAWVFAGWWGALIAAAAVALVSAVAPRFSPAAVMRMAGGRPSDWIGTHDLEIAVAAIATRAGLRRVPRLYRVPGRRAVAFSAGTREDGAIALSDGLIAHLSAREILGVLAHEIAHIAAEDSNRMRVAEILGRVNHGIAVTGVIAAIAVTLLVPGAAPPAWAIWVLALAPTGMALLTLALSREREYAADATAARLTGDPQGLSMALVRLESMTHVRWMPWAGPIAAARAPHWLDTHPPTADRIARLRLLAVPSHREVPAARTCPARRSVLHHT